MKTVLLTGCLLAGLFVQAQDVKNVSVRQFMQAAVTEFLTNKNFSSAGAQQIFKDNELFVGKCQICTGSQAAFEAYGKNPGSNPDARYADTALYSASKEVRLKALERLVSQAVADYYEAHNFNRAERAAMQVKLEDEKKKSSMRTSGKYCASCTGSCKRPEQQVF